MDHIIEELDHVNSENQAMVKKEKELQVQLQNIMKENKALEENYQQEKLKHKCINESRDHIIKELDHVNDENQAMAKKEKELQVQMQSLMKENQALEENYQQEKLKHKHAVQELEQSFKKIRCNIIDKLEEKLQQGEEQIISLEEKYLKEVNAHEMTKENLSQTIEELQVKFNREREEKQELEGKYENEKSLHEETQEQLVQANQQNKEKSAKIKELEFQLQQAVVENMWTNENYQEEKSAHKHTKEQLNHFEEFYEKEKTEHRITREELEQCIEKVKELHIRVKEVEEGNLLLEESYQKEKSDLKSMTDKAEKLLQLKDQLQQAGEDNEHIQEKHVAEMSMLRLQCQHALEDLDQAHSENKSMDQKLEEIQKLRESEKSHRDLQIQQLQARDKQFTQDLHACLSVMRDTKTLKQRLVTMKRCYLDSKHAQISEIGEHKYQLENRDLSKRLQGCKNLLKVNSDTISRLEQQLSATVQQRDEREKKYVQLINSHIVKEHQLKKLLEKTLLKLEKISKPITKRVSSWWHKKVLKKRPNETPQEEEEANLYPEDWRLSDLPEDNKSVYCFS
ncbi:trichohyalin-like [Takifugu flavidus]|uniref:trichohyalin-like n=1 Tax=Takifugu flavidus TaxID=433684 RepID=UPI002544AAB3|nr:trichohyalin-like [Takifugu flavidus]